MFYIHALALPMFSFLGTDLLAQVRTVHAGPRTELSLQSAAQGAYALMAVPYTRLTTSQLPPLPILPFRTPSLQIPAFYIPLAVNVLTQLFCVAGVNRLTARVSSLSVTLVLVVRKAVSLAISVLLLGNSRGSAYLWGGAAAVLVGTIGYTLGSTKPPPKKKAE